jgi:hypothetical protein
LGSDNYFEAIIKDRMDKAEGKQFEFNTNREVKIQKMPSVQKNILFTRFELSEMDYGFDSRRFYQKKLENLKSIDYPDLERA